MKNKVKNQIGKNNPNYKHGNTNNSFVCSECSKNITYSSGLYGTGMCSNCCKKGQRHWKYKERYKQPSGYILTHAPLHPCAKRLPVLLEHRLVMEAYINKISFKKWLKFGRIKGYPKNVRFLNKKELIHHINGIRDDNRIENLYLTNNKSHEHWTLLHIVQRKIRKLEEKLNVKK